MKPTLDEVYHAEQRDGVFAAIAAVYREDADLPPR